MENIVNYFTDKIHTRSGRHYLKCNESDKIEFKQSLQLSGEAVSKTYLKTVCGFANNKGGVIVFGVTPDTNELVGLTEKFENLDNKYFSTTFADGIDGSFEYSFFTHRHKGILLGFLFVKEAKSKPVILKTNFDNQGEKGIAGDIYFRYPARTSRILFSDLRNIINVEIKNQTNKLLNQIEYLVEQGPDNVAILNTDNGELNTENNSTKFILSKEILDEINIIQEGNIVQKEGAPAYVIKGAIEIANTKFVEKKVATTIHSADIFDSFFEQKCDDPKGFLTELLYKDTPYYPIFFFIKVSGLAIPEAVEFLSQQNEHDIKKSTKKKIIERLKAKNDYPKIGKIISGVRFDEYKFDKLEKDISEIADRLNLKGNTRIVSVVRSATLTFFKAQQDIPKSFHKKHIKEMIEAFTHLTEKDFKKNPNYYLTILRDLYKQSKSIEGVTKTFFRKAVCLYDESVFK